MSLALTVKAMVEAGCSAEQIADVVSRVDESRRAKARAGNARRQAEYRRRHAESNGNNAVTGRDTALQPVIQRDSCAREIDTKLTNILPKDIPTVYPKGKPEDVAAGEAAIEVLGSLECPDTASAMQALVADALEQQGFDVEMESPTIQLGDYRAGRIDVVASRGGGRVGIELDTRRPRRRSLVKLRLFEGFRIVGLRGINGIQPPEGIDRVVALPVRQATIEEAFDRRLHNRSSEPTAAAQARMWFARFFEIYPPRDGNNPKKPAMEVFGKLLKAGADPEAIIAGTRAYAASREGEPAKFTVQAVRFLRDRMFEDVHHPSPVARAKIATAPMADTRVFVELDTPEWGRWLEYRRLIKAPRPVPYEQQGTRKRGAYFPTKLPPISSEWPPDATVTSPPPLPKLDEASASSCSAPEREGQGRQATEARFAYFR